MNDEMDEIKKWQGQPADDIKREAVALAYKRALAKVGREAARKEIKMLEATMPYHNGIMQANLRSSIQTLDAMLFCMSVIPGKIGMELMQRKSFVDFVELLYAMRELMVEDRDMRVKQQPNL